MGHCSRRDLDRDRDLDLDPQCDCQRDANCDPIFVRLLLLIFNCHFDSNSHSNLLTIQPSAIVCRRNWPRVAPSLATRSLMYIAQSDHLARVQNQYEMIIQWDYTLKYKPSKFHQDARSLLLIGEEAGGALVLRLPAEWACGLESIRERGLVALARAA